MVLWNNAAMPLDFSGNDLAAEMSYVAADQRYDGKRPGMLGKTQPRRVAIGISP